MNQIESQGKEGKTEVIGEIDTSNQNIALAKTMIYVLHDVQQYYDTKRFKQVTDAINQTLKMLQDIVCTGTIDRQAAISALDVAADVALDVVTTDVAAADTAADTAAAIAAARAARAAARAARAAAIAAEAAAVRAAEAAAVRVGDKK